MYRRPARGYGRALVVRRLGGRGTYVRYSMNARHRAAIRIQRWARRRIAMLGARRSARQFRYNMRRSYRF